MPVYKDKKNNTWYVKGRYKDWTGKSKNLMKRGFELKREAVEWEENFRLRLDSSLNMSFADFYQIYKEDLGARLKDSTWETKAAIIETKLLPFFGAMRLRDITSVEVIRWQNEMMKQKMPNGKPYSQTYLKTLHNQLSAIFNHAVRFYKLSENPARVAGAIGEKEGGEMSIWSEEEYHRFAEAVMDKPVSYYCFEMLYWCGIREGELLALTKNDFNFKKQEVSISKTYHRSKGEDRITSPRPSRACAPSPCPHFCAKRFRTISPWCTTCGPTTGLFP